MKKLTLFLTSAILAAASLFTVTACSGTSSDTIVVGATASPHAEILEYIRSDIEARGYKLRIISYSGYTEENPSTADGSLDANFFQHQPYLDDYNSNVAEKDRLVSAGTVHYEPFGIYSSSVNAIDEVKNGSEKIVLVPNDLTNEARALLLLQDNGLITLRDGVGLTATKADVTANPYNLKIVEVQAEQIATSVDDAALAAINGNYALAAGFGVDDAIALEAADSVAAETYANIVAVKPENLDSEKTKVLIECLQTEKVRAFIEENYGKSVIAKF